MNGLQQFLQAASNEAAYTVAAPVDAISWLLRKAGVPVPEQPVMSSDWMRRHGLLVDVPENAASLAGQTFGLLSPVVAAAKTPQIARGLLSAGDNLATPRALHPQTGAVVWHGSPHKFDKFDASKIGTGEGAQAYGHGLYLADSQDVARAYRQELSSTGFTYADDAAATRMKDMTNFDDHVWRVIDDMAKRNNADPKKTAAALRAYADRFSSGRESIRAAADLMDAGRMAPTEAGALYKVDLPDEAIARMLDWDKPLSQQAQTARALRPVAGRVPGLDDALQPFELGSTTGRTVNDYISRALSPADAARMFKDAGIPGIRYLDGGSRGAGIGTSNYVVFPGEESLLRILERNGVPLP